MKPFNNLICKIFKNFHKNGHFIFYNIYFKKFLRTEKFGKQIKIYEKIDSTNTKAKNLIFNGKANNGNVIIAKSQYCGRGRLGRTWYSEKFGGIYMSIILKPNMEISNINKITLLAGLSICKTLNKIYKANALVKWPNDIIINNKKLCGILTEAFSFKNNTYVILGIGLNTNCNHFPNSINHKATSLFLENKNKINNLNLICNILIDFETNYNKFIKNPNLLINEYKKYCASIGKYAKTSNKSLYKLIVNISDEGFLVLKDSNGKISYITSGDTIVQGIY